METAHSAKLTLDQAYTIWQTFDFDHGHKTWDDFMVYLAETTGRTFSLAASAKLRRYVRKTAGGTRGF